MDFRHTHTTSHNVSCHQHCRLLHAAPFKGDPHLTPTLLAHKQVKYVSKLASLASGRAKASGPAPSHYHPCMTMPSEAWWISLGRGSTHPACGRDGRRSKVPQPKKPHSEWAAPSGRNTKRWRLHRERGLGWLLLRQAQPEKAGCCPAHLI